MRFTVYIIDDNFMFDLVSATVAEIAARCTTEVIDIERATVSYLNVSGPLTTVWNPVKADLPGYFAFSDCRMSTI